MIFLDDNLSFSQAIPTWGQIPALLSLFQLSPGLFCFVVIVRRSLGSCGNTFPVNLALDMRFNNLSFCVYVCLYFCVYGVVCVCVLVFVCVCVCVCFDVYVCV